MFGDLAPRAKQGYAFVMDKDIALQIATLEGEVKSLEREEKRHASIASWESAALPYRDKAKAELEEIQVRLREMREKLRQLKHPE